MHAVSLCLAWLLAGSLLLMGCSPELDDSTPEGTLVLFLQAVDRSSYEHAALEEAYGYLSDDSRRRLVERARMATALGGRAFEPWEMIVNGRTRVAFMPGRNKIEVERDGDRAVLRTEEPSARLEAVHEHGAWKLDLDLPPVR